ncbi:MAG: protein kinase [Anaerolineales bacterium]|nr:protein kinase [Anaerolineales bacterium]
MPFSVGETVGPYQIVEQLGQGGMATVFKAYHPALDRYVAIKVLHPAFTIEPNFLTRFRREAQVIAKLEHPNIVPVYDFAEHEGRPYLVLKFIEGDTLKARMSHGTLGVSEISEIIESVGAALEYAHQQGVLHRDVKPSNVLLSNDRRIYLADFGLARIAQAGESTISSDIMLGTPQYISPEQALGQRDLDGGTDIYSFGVMIYEMLLGRVPYSADTPYSIIHDHIYAPLPMPHTIKGDIPEAVELVLLKALAKDRADRFSDVGAMVDAWKKAAEGTILPQLVSPVETSDEAGVASAAQPVLEERDAATIMGGGLASQPAPALVKEEPAAVSNVRRTPKRLWFGLAGFVLACCMCLVGAFAISPQLRSRVSQLVASPGVPTQAQPTGPGEATLPAQTPAVLPSRTPGRLPLPGEVSLEEAQQMVASEPDNPIAHLGLAVAYWDQNMPDEAEAAYRAALERAGDNPEFYLRAGDIMLSRQVWPEAARMYLEAARLVKEPLPKELQERLRQALYLAAGDPESEDLLAKLPGSRISPDFIIILQARQVLKKGQIARAKVMAQRLAERPTDLQEIQLLEAEILITEGQDELARDKLNGLVNDPEVPQWIREVADYILREIIPGD